MMKLKDAWHLASVKLAAFVGALFAAITASPELLLGIVSFIPGEPFARLLFALGVGALTFAGPTLVRMWPQKGVSNDAAE